MCGEAKEDHQFTYIRIHASFETSKGRLSLTKPTNTVACNIGKLLMSCFANLQTYLNLEFLSKRNNTCNSHVIADPEAESSM